VTDSFDIARFDPNSGELLLSAIDHARITVSKSTDPAKKSQLGQFLTPVRTAKFMAGLFAATNGEECRLLDAGAGIGSLTCAFLERCLNKELQFENVSIAAFELDTAIHAKLVESLDSLHAEIPFSYQLIGGDFIEQAVNAIQFGRDSSYTHAILNPPYKKINSYSRHRLLLRQAGIEPLFGFCGLGVGNVDARWTTSGHCSAQFL
jgi:adenine-specific DNA-methyltransferase